MAKNINLIRDLARAAVPHIPTLGFSIGALEAAIASSSISASSTASPFSSVSSAQIHELFRGPPSSPTSATRQLLNAHDELSIEAMASDFQNSVEQTPSQHSAKQDDSMAYDNAVMLIESRLQRSYRVSPFLPDALGALSSSPLPLPSSASVLSNTPLSALPNPFPLLQRAGVIANEALITAEWKGNYSTDWYSARFILSHSFLLSELHMLSPEIQSSTTLKPSIDVLRKLAYITTPGSSLLEENWDNTKQWAMWGSRGWLGIFRSFGI